MRKMFIIMIFTILFLCGCESKNSDVEKSTSTSTVTTTSVDTDKTTNSTETTKKQSSTTSNKTEKTTNKATNTTKSSTTNKTTSSTTKKSTTTKNNSGTKVCSDNDPGLLKYLENERKSDKYSVFFYSLKEAKAYGDYASKNFGYGYWYNPYAQQYDGTLYVGNNCYKELYAVRLKTDNLTCGDNDEYHYKSVYIPATPKEKLVDVFKYVTNNLGWHCSDRSWN